MLKFIWLKQLDPTSQVYSLWPQWLLSTYPNRQGRIWLFECCRWRCTWRLNYEGKFLRWKSSCNWRQVSTAKLWSEFGKRFARERKRKRRKLGKIFSSPTTCVGKNKAEGIKNSLCFVFSKKCYLVSECIKLSPFAEVNNRVKELGIYSTFWRGKKRRNWMRGKMVQKRKKSSQLNHKTDWVTKRLFVDGRGDTGWTLNRKMEMQKEKEKTGDPLDTGSWFRHQSTSMSDLCILFMPVSWCFAVNWFILSLSLPLSPFELLHSPVPGH